MTYLYIKAIHIIFIITWFAGLFYMVRIFIYHIEAAEKPEPDRSVLVKEYKRNARRLWFAITWPSAILTLIFGTWLLLLMPGYLKQGFMHVKLGFVLLLYIYHLACHRIFRQLQNDIVKYTSPQLRVWNEVATVLLIAIVFLIVLKNTLSMFWGLVGLIIFTLVLLLAIRIYKRVREKS